MTGTGTRTADLFERDLAHVWHPFTQMADYALTPPMIVAEASGNWLIDTDGRRYLDAISSLWCNVHGHRVPEIDAAIIAQLERVAHSTLLGSANEPSIELATLLATLTPPGLDRVFYTENGASAVEVALKIAYQYWRARGEDRRTFLAFDHAYHGDTIGAVSVGGIETFHEAFGPLLFDVLRAPSPYFYRCPDGHGSHDECGRACLAAVERQLAENLGTVCAVIIEPLVQGAAGMIIQPRGFLRSLAALCRRYDTLLIADEVATGFGRTGRMFACEHEEVVPDMMVVGKGLTGGYLPLSAVIASDAVYESFLGRATDGRTFYHGHTYTGNQLCCAAGIANLALMRDRDTVGAGRERAADLAAGLEQLTDLPHVGEVRQRGLMVGIELVADRESRRPFDVAARAAWHACLRLRDRGVLVRPLGDVVVLMPPLSITAAEVRLLTDAVAAELSAISA